MSSAGLMQSGLQPAGVDPRRTIPFDQSFTFKLKGELNKVTNQTATVSIEAAFTAVAVGYGVLPEVQRVTFGPKLLADVDLPEPKAASPVLLVRSRIAGALAAGPVPPELAPVAPLQQLETVRQNLVAVIPKVPSGDALSPAVQGNINDLAGQLAEVRQTFRVLVSKISPKTPLSDTRLDAREVTLADLTEQLADLRENLREVVSKIPSDTPLSAFPPDAQGALVGPPRRIAVGDLANSLARTLDESDFSAAGEIGPKTAAALQTGIRLNPDVARFFLQNRRDLSLHPDQLARLFETVAAPPDRIQFLYALFDEGTGREFQSEPILNIAGLGIADGDRPFRYFAQPITFSPRTTIRLEITEKSQFQGELHVSLHGFKVLGGAGTPTSTTRHRKIHRTR